MNKQQAYALGMVVFSCSLMVSSVLSESGIAFLGSLVIFVSFLILLVWSSKDE